MLKSGGGFGDPVWTGTAKSLWTGCLVGSVSLAWDGGAAAAGHAASGERRGAAATGAPRLSASGLGEVTCSALRGYGLLDQTLWRIRTAL